MAHRTSERSDGCEVRRCGVSGDRSLRAGFYAIEAGGYLVHGVSSVLDTLVRPRYRSAACTRATTARGEQRVTPLPRESQ